MDIYGQKIDFNGNIVGDDSTDITNIRGIQCDSVVADGDQVSGILLATSDVQIVDGNEVNKDRPHYEPLIYPTSNIISPVSASSTEAYVESVRTFFDSS